MTTKPTYTPAIRFPDFLNDGEWEVKRLGDLFLRITDRNKENNKNVLTISAQFGLVNQFEYFSKNVAASDVTNYYIIKKGDFAYNKSRSQGYPFGAIKPLLLYDKGVVSTLYICFRLKEDCGCDADFFRFYFETGMINDQISNIAQEGARNHGLLNISTEDFFNINLLVPPLAEQRRIAACLSALDEMLAATNGKLEQLKAYKKGLMQQLFANPMGGGKSLIINNLQIQTLRFPEFRNEKEWEEKKLGEFLYEHKTKSDGKSQVYSVSVSKGVINQMEYLGRSFAASDTSKYKLVKPFDVVYTKSPTGNFPYGIVKQSMINHNVIVSPLYGVFSPINQYIGYIIHSYFESPERTNNYLAPIVQKGAKNTIQISNETFLSQKVYFPSEYNEQRKIASCLSSMDDQINAYTEKVGLLGQYKKGLMQRMFPQNQMN